MPVLPKALRTKVSYRWICNSCIRRHVSSSAPTASNATSLHKLPDGPARTRFAPSPTGYLHLGSLRTALFNYLLAKSTGGQFLLRLEDTDQKRTVADAEDRLHQDLEWAGLQCDEGPRIGGPYGPYRQSQRTALYREHAEILLRSGHAYRCFCTHERLHAIAKQRTELGLPTDYDRTCAYISKEESEDRAAKGEAHVVRFMVPSVYPQFTDIVHGKVRHRQDQTNKAQLYPAFEDPILIKSDGFPTYHLANVVDDHHMKITHVVRGSEWMSSTPKHLAMYQAFEWEPPAFAHVGLLTDQNHQKLSKRNMDIDISAFRDRMGVFPETLTNFVALLGWSHQKRNDVMDLQELISNFSMKFTKGETVVTFEKLWYLQRAHAERYAKSDTAVNGAKILLMTNSILQDLKDKDWIDSKNFVLGRHAVESYVTKLVQLDARNYMNAPAFIERHKYLFQAPDDRGLLKSRPSGHLHHMSKDMSSVVHRDTVLQQVLSNLDLIPQEGWTTDKIRQALNAIITEQTKQSLEMLEEGRFPDAEQNRKSATKSWSKLVHGHVRWAIAAGLPGLDGAESMRILGKEETLTRLGKAIRILSEKQPSAGAHLESEVAEACKPSQNH